MNLLTVRDVATKLKISQRQVYKLTSCGQFPKRIRLRGSSRWVEEEIDLFIRSDCNIARFKEAIEKKGVAA